MTLIVTYTHEAITRAAPAIAALRRMRGDATGELKAAVERALAAIDSPR